MLMSFLGAIGYIMSGAGLRELLELFYAPGAVDPILNGKSYSRAIRGLCIIDAAMNSLLTAAVFDRPISEFVREVKIGENSIDERHSDSEDEEELNLITHADEHSLSATDSTSDGNVQMSDSSTPEWEDLIMQMNTLYDKLSSNAITASEVNQSAILLMIKDRLNAGISTMKKSRTAAIWIQFLDMFQVLHTFLKAERTGNWFLHLKAVQDMLPYFAASGHNLYAKSARIYPEEMMNLYQENPIVYHQFSSGLHSIRRSDAYWAGLSSDLIIEQILMRSIKTSGGMTHGRGIKEIQRLTWLLAMPARSEISQGMEEFTQTKFTSSNQHRETFTTRIERDVEDTQKILAAISMRNPFAMDDCSPQNLITGITVDESVNCDKAVEIGSNILKNMTGKTTADYTFRKKDRVTTMSCKSKVKVDGEPLDIKPDLLFQRLIIASQTEDIDGPALFSYELCSYPPALFDTSLLMRQANKPQFADALWNMLPDQEATPLPDSVHYVLDGGALLHRIPWPAGLTYHEICVLYQEYVTRKYRNATVVFDGYDEEGTKCSAHTRQNRGRAASSILFDASMQVALKKEVLLANSKNKQRFINLLGEYLESRGCRVLHAKGDANVLIAKTSVESAYHQDTILVGDDTDLLVLLCLHADLNAKELIFSPEPKKCTKQRRVWNKKQVKLSLGQELCDNIFLHALLGCDTTSRLYGIGKSASIKKFKSSQEFRQIAEVFAAKDMPKEAVIAAGENALKHIYGGESDDTLDQLR